MKKKLYTAAFMLLTGIFCFNSCSKKTTEDPPVNPCTGVTVVVNATLQPASAAGVTDGRITATATGGSGFSFSLNGAAFVSSGTFSNLAAGNYTVTAKNSNGCTGTGNFTITTAASDPCAGKTITVSGAATSSDKCASTGSITITATGGTGFTYSLNNGTYQASATFNNLAAATYTIAAKDGGGCIKTSSVTVNAANAGTNFTAVKNLIQSICVTCHNSSNQNGGMSFSDDCNIVVNKDRIKARAVDGNPSFMPQGGELTQADKNKITSWINAGGKYTD